MPLGPKRLELTDLAETDLAGAVTYLMEQAGVEIAAAFIQNIDDKLHHLAATGHSGVSREWLSSGLRLHVIGDYCVYFRVTESATRVIRILHGAQDVNAIVLQNESLS